ncbi:phage tail spike protein [Pontibacillus litoralis]|uniref:Tail spike domain-containing protein n=1 Tax=Pontibacillus litoralis JSM 072002 TaxID=1385512 RepID=A0A0A5GA28_9BACI|nr:phage tail spike protein [Pontibacillus litoralis]KGX88033.1 hypothetical protein N784_12985 [Pontibacillus litoralis JSM 072002]
MIHAIDGQTDQIVGIIPNEEIIEDVYKRSLKDTLETFNFTTFADKSYSEYLGKRNKVIIQDEDGRFRELLIHESGKIHEDSLEMNVFCVGSYQVLKKSAVIKPQTLKKQTPDSAAGIALDGTEWQVGIVEGTGVRTFHIKKHTNPYSLLKRIATEFDLELDFRIETNGHKITGRYVDLVQQIGQWRGREVEFGKDLLHISRRELTDNVYTALVGLGPEKDDGTRLEIFVEDKEALQRWGRPDPVTGELQHIIGTYEPQSDDQNMSLDRLRVLTENELEKRVNEVVEYETTIADLENVPNMQNQKTRFGDTLRIKDTKFHPPLFLEARVFEMSGSIKRRKCKKIKLGDYIEFSEEEVQSVWESLRDEIRKRLARMLITTIASSAGETFKNGLGTTDLTAQVFLNGEEVDEEGELYGYVWRKYDKHGLPVSNWNKSGKTITATAEEIDEKAVFACEIVLEQVASIGRITVTNIFDGERGPQGIPGSPGKDGQSLYTWIKYADDEKGGGMSNYPENKPYIGIAENKSTSNESDNPSDYKWSKVLGPKGEQGKEGPQGIRGEDGQDGMPRYTWIRYADDEKGNGMSNFPIGKSYIGIATNKLTEQESSNPGDYTWQKTKGEQGPQGLQGLQGPRGNQGIQGPKGVDGKPSYTHIAYADTASGGGFSQSPAGKLYMGVYVDDKSQDSSNPSDYKWSLIKGADGEDGIPGKPGADGRTPYLHIAYADTSTGGGFSQDPTGKEYIGTYTDFKQADSNNPNDYKWQRAKGDKGDKGPQGVQGPRGKDGQTLYTWVKYADTPTSGMSDSPTGKEYIGLAYNNTSPSESSRYSDYKWSLVKGDKGVPGAPGKDGQTTYTWVKYADDKDGNGMSDDSEGKRYLGLAYNKTTANESSNPSDYNWSPLYDNVRPGVRNYILDSVNYPLSPYKISTTKTITEDATVPSGYIATFKAARDNDSETNEGAFFLPIKSKAPKATSFGERYMFSGYIKGNREFNVRVLGNSSKMISRNISKITTNWFKFECVYEITDENAPNYNMHFWISDFNMGDEIHFHSIKIEKGNIATDWTPAPEDERAYAEYIANLKAEAERIKAEAYADGIVTAEEKARIDDVQAKLKQAKQHANDVSNQAENNAKDHADAVAKAKAELAKTQAKAYADGRVTEEEKRAIADAEEKLRLAKEYANTQADEAESNAKGHANAVSEAAYLDAINDAEEYMESNGVMQGAKYNGVSITNADGFVTARGDGLVRTVMNSTLGYVIQRRSSKASPWQNVLYFDTQGNAKYAGDIQGSNGVFGNVTAVDGDFFLQDEFTSTKYIISPKQNKIKDHSFEMVKTGGGVSATYNWLDMAPNSRQPLVGWRIGGGDPRVAAVLAPDVADAHPMLGAQSIVVKSGNFVQQLVTGISPSTTYTLSGFFKRQWKVMSGGIPSFTVWHANAFGAKMTRIKVGKFSKVPNDYSVVRHSMTFKTPSNFATDDTLMVVVWADTDRWVQCDGVQLVEGRYPSAYSHEDSIWDTLKGDYPIRSKKQILWSGSVYLTDVANIKPDKNIHDCENGWILEWARTGRNVAVQHTIIPKMAIQRGMDSIHDIFTSSFSGSNVNVTGKIINASYNKLTGNAMNDNGGNNSNSIQLRAVYEF